MLDYLHTCGYKRLNEQSFTDVDNLICSQLSYLDYSKADRNLPQSLKILDGIVGFGVMAQDNCALFRLAIDQKRFCDSKAFRYTSEFSEADTRQFAAITFLLPDNTAFVSFRGTDSTIVGWKEDFMLSFTTPVPAQVLAVQYLNDIGSLLDCPLRVGGHSKGGNLAIYASAFCNEAVQKHIITVYSNDGPGFEDKVLSSEGYRRIKTRIRRFIPEFSAVGILMDSDSEVTVVKSNSVGFYQHNPYSWQVNGTDFVKLPYTSLGSDMISTSQRDWFRALSVEKREKYTNLLFDLLLSGNARTLRELRTDPSSLLSAVHAAKNLSQEDKEELAKLAKQVMTSLYAGSSAAVRERFEKWTVQMKAKIKAIEEELQS